MTLRTILPALAALVMLSNSAMAQSKIATVNVSKLFDGYYKTKLAQADIDQRKQEIEKDENGMVDELKTDNTDYQQLLDESADQALSADDRDHKKQAAEAKYKEIQDSKAALDQYDRSARAKMTEEVQRMHDKILAAIQAQVATVAKAGGYTIVLDASTQSAASTPAVIYSSGDADLTAEVLKELNSGAPIDTTNLGSPGSSATPSLINTKSP